MSEMSDLRTLIEGYRLRCLAEGRQPTTAAWYGHKLAIFQRYLQDRQLPTDLRQITIQHLRAFLIYLRDEVIRDRTTP